MSGSVTSFANSATESFSAPLRGPTAYQGRAQYYAVLNLFFAHGVKVRRYERFKRIGDKQAWSNQREWLDGMELDQEFILRQGFDNANARMDELVDDGCEFVSYRKHPAPGGRVTYLLISWPTNGELERNRSARILRKQPKQAPLPRELTPFQHPQFRIEADREPKHESRHATAERFEREFGKPKTSGTTPSTTEIDLPLFDTEVRR